VYLTLAAFRWRRTYRGAVQDLSSCSSCRGERSVMAPGGVVEVAAVWTRPEVYVLLEVPKS